MLNNWFTKEVKRLSFEDIQYILKHPSQYILINTLSTNEQHCLIPYTLSYVEEENVINTMIKEYNFYNKTLIVYGKHCNDDTCKTKCDQLVRFGFSNVKMYPGGMFEWLCLQDIYGSDDFPTTTKELDLYKYRPSSQL